MDAREAREQLEMVDGILSRGERRGKTAPLAYILWGLTGAAYYAPYVPGLESASVFLVYLGFALSVSAIWATVWTYLVARAGRSTLLDRQALGTFAGVTLLMIVLKFIWNAHGLVGGIAFAYFWSFGFAVPLLLLGLGGNRVLLIGGAALVIGVVVASLFPGTVAITLALANIVGLCGPGIYFHFARK